MAAALIFAMAVPAMAAGPQTTPPSGGFGAASGQITLDNTIPGEKYELYRIFDLSYSGTGNNQTVAYVINDDWVGFFNSEGDGAKYIVDSQSAEKKPDGTTAVEYAVVTVNVKDGKYVKNDAEGTKQTKYIAVTEETVADFAQDALKWAAGHRSGKEGVTDSVNVVKEVTGTANETKTVVPDLPLGTYLVYPKGASVIENGKDEPSQNAWASICSLTSTVPEAEISIKSTYPEVDKKIVEGNNRVEENSASIGESVSYEVTSKVPSMVGYESENEKYFFILHDTLSKGLTFNDDVEIKIGALTLAKGGTTLIDSTTAAPTTGDYYVRVTKEAGSADSEAVTKVTIVFTDFKKWNSYKSAGGADAVDYTGADIRVTYSATVNQDAKIGTDANTNTIYLEYSNDPTVDSGGKSEDFPDEPGDNPPVGTSPEVKTYTYVTGVQLKKIDGSEEKNPLTGAKFSISGEHVKAVIVNKEIFRKADNGTYWRLKNGTYTTDDPNGEGRDKDQYESTTQKYEKVTVVKKESPAPTVPFEAEGWVDAEGLLTFTGLGEGEYTITEMVAPDGYNLLTKPILLEISAKFASEKKDNVDFPDGVKTGVKWTVTKQIEGEEESQKETLTTKSIPASDALNAPMIPVYTFDVVNLSGTLLPSTGGIGTTVFYVGGGLVALGAAGLLIAKRRKNREA